MQGGEGSEVMEAERAEALGELEGQATRAPAGARNLGRTCNRLNPLARR